MTVSVISSNAFRASAKRIKVILTAGLCLAAGVLLLLWYIGVLGGNVRTVTPNRVYRSAQLTGHNLNDVLSEDHIRTVINLRGGSPGDRWYRSEMASCDAYHVRHVDITLNASRMPPPKQLQKILATFDTTEYPVLYHCKAGSDRSGLVGAIYLAVYQRMPVDQAEKSQLTFRYGHVSWGQTHAMDDFFRLYRKTSGGLGLRDWITTRYPGLYKNLPANEQTAQ